MGLYFAFKRCDMWNGKENWVPEKSLFLAMMQLIFAVKHVKTDLFLSVRIFWSQNVISSAHM
jgi:hypothetical protein